MWLKSFCFSIKWYKISCKLTLKTQYISHLATTKNAKIKRIDKSQINKIKCSYENIQIQMMVEKRTEEENHKWLIIKWRT